MVLRPPELPRAACRSPEAAAHFHQAGRAHGAAKRVCNRCPERPECLAWGLEHEKYGIWGGHGPDSRDEIRKRFGITLEEI